MNPAENCHTKSVGKNNSPALEGAPPPARENGLPGTWRSSSAGARRASGWWGQTGTGAHR